MDKKEIRKKILEKRDLLSKEEWMEKSKAIETLFLNSDWYRTASSIMSYVSFRNEADTLGIINRILSDQKKLIVPKTNDRYEIKPILIKDLEKEMRPGRFGILEPISDTVFEGKLDIVIVPGVVFDPKGNRVGFGKGYYDRFLQDKQDVLKVALAYSFQVEEQVPHDPLDIPVDMIITEKGSLMTAKSEE